MTIEPKDAYEQGSQLCVQYSALTMSVRTLSHQILLAQGAAILASLVGHNLVDTDFLPGILLVGGSVVMVAAVILGLLNHHHSTAFRAVRDLALVPLEAEGSLSRLGVGPWTAHKLERDSHPIASTLAWHLPFLGMFLLGLVSVSGWAYLGRNSLVGFLLTLAIAFLGISGLTIWGSISGRGRRSSAIEQIIAIESAAHDSRLHPAAGAPDAATDGD